MLGIQRWEASAPLLDRWSLSESGISLMKKKETWTNTLNAIASDSIMHSMEIIVNNTVCLFVSCLREWMFQVLITKKKNVTVFMAGCWLHWPRWHHSTMDKNNKSLYYTHGMNIMHLHKRAHNFNKCYWNYSIERKWGRPGNYLINGKKIFCIVIGKK